MNENADITAFLLYFIIFLETIIWFIESEQKFYVSKICF